MKDNLTLQMNVLIQLFDKQGHLKSEQKVHNAVTTVGKQAIADHILAAPSAGKPTHCEVGTGTTGSTKLAAYVTGSRTAFTSKTRSGAVITTVTDFAAGVGTATLTEAGLFDSATQDNGNMWNYVTFAAQVKGASDTLKITWTITIN